jgi:flagellar basal-body rod protein FlgF
MIDGVKKMAKDMSVKVLRQELIANNLANVNTPGFKTQRAFSTVLKQSLGTGAAQMGEGVGGGDGVSRGPALPDAIAASNGLAAPKPSVPSKPLGEDGQKTVAIYTSFEQGRIEYTHRSLDLAIDGEGFFVVDTPLGERFTRAGSFTLSEAGLLATYGGNLVMGQGGPIAIQGEQVEVTPDGRVVVDGEEVDTLKIVTFSAPETLARSGNTFASTTEPYDEVDFAQTQVVQGALERSNVNPIDEMVEMIALHRGFEADQQSIRLQIDATKKLLERVGDLE